jgi:arginase family enzyme
VRHLSQREAAFPREALFKAALDFGLPTTIDAIEKRVSALVRSGELVPGSGEHKGWLTSREALDCVRKLRGLSICGANVVEISPPYDHAELTSLLGAALVFEFLSLMAIE